MGDKITSRQVIMLVTISRLATAISVLPTLNVRPYNQDVWVVALLSIVYSHIFMIPLLFLANKFKDSCMIGYLQKIYGVPLGRVIGFIYGLFFLVHVVDGGVVQTELVATSILPDTSQIIILVGMLLTSILCVNRGAHAGLKGVEILGPISLFIVVFLIALGISNFDTRLLMPILFDSSFTDINLGAMEVSLYFIEVFALFMLVPYLENKDDIIKIFTKSTIYTLSFLTLIIVVVQISIGVYYSKYTKFPFLNYARNIDVFEVVERIDLLAVVAWLITSLIRLMTTIYVSVLAFRVVFNKMVKDKVILVVIGIITGIIMWYILNMMSIIILRNYVDMFLQRLFIIFAIILPSISCIVYFIRRKSIEGKASNS